MVLDVVSAPTTKESCSLTADMINAADNATLDPKTTISKEEGYVASFTTHVKGELSEKSKSSANYSTKDIPQKMSATVMASSKIQNYHKREIIYKIYEDNILKNNKEIKFIYITAPSFIKDTYMFGHCM